MRKLAARKQDSHRNQSEWEKEIAFTLTAENFSSLDIIEKINANY